ncbi:hypothetical protein VXE32_007789, partial [Burkholderia cepacia]|nr:hypothetical protein [Burkholderia cepacia]
ACSEFVASAEAGGDVGVEFDGGDDEDGGSVMSLPPQALTNRTERALSAAPSANLLRGCIVSPVLNSDEGRAGVAVAALDARAWPPPCNPDP